MNNKSVTTNLIWRFLERCGAQGISFLVSIILARLLAPEVYGIIALVTVFTAIMQVFVDSGLGNALIQKKDADDLDYSTVFFFNLGACVVLYVFMYIIAPIIATFYAMPELTLVIRVLSLTLIISGVKNIQQAYVSKNMLFKRFFFATLGGTIISAVIGIGMAYMGYGVWALVAQNLVNATIDTMILWITVKWRPKFMFSFKRLKGLFSYGWKLLASALLDRIYTEIRQLIIGKLYTSSDLAFYNKGSQLPNLIVTNINTSIDSVLLPTMSEEQDDKGRIKSMTRRAIQTSTYVMAPLMIGLACTGDIIIELLFTDKWLPCVPYLQIFCITFLFYPIHTANLNAIKAMGRSDYFLKLEIIKKCIGVVVLIITMWYSPFIVCVSELMMTFISQIINASPNKKLLNYSIFEQWKDIAPGLLLATAMGVVVWILGRCLPFANIIVLVIQVMIGATIYLLGSVLCRVESFQYILSIVKKIMKRG